jgi:hypothetical protein
MVRLLQFVVGFFARCFRSRVIWFWKTWRCGNNSAF